MRFKYRRLMKKLNIALYVAVLLLVVAFFWHISAGKKPEVRQVSSSDINPNKVEKIISLGNDKNTDESVEDDSEETSESDESIDSESVDGTDEDLDVNNQDDIDDLDDETGDASKDEDSEDKEGVNTDIKNGDTFVVNLDNEIDYVNIRSEADENSSIQGILKYGAGGTVVKAGAEWSEIVSGDITGYVKNEFCLFGESAERKIEEIGGYVAVVNEDSLKVREEKSTDSRVLGLCGIGSEYNCVKPADGDEWIQITYEGQTGYVSADFVTVRSRVAVSN